MILWKNCGCTNGFVGFYWYISSYNAFSYVWLRYFRPLTSGTWTFKISTDDKAQLYIGDKTSSSSLSIINSDRLPRTSMESINMDDEYTTNSKIFFYMNVTDQNTSTVSLQANTTYEIILYFGESTSSQKCGFELKSPNDSEYSTELSYSTTKAYFSNIPTSLHETSNDTI